MINAIAIDDEPVALDIIRKHAGRVPFISLTHTFSSAKQALDFLATGTTDLIFLDINMPGINGLEFAALIIPNIPLVFTTAYSTYAIIGFDMAITDFLLKPINYSRFLQACTLAQTRSSISADSATVQKDVLFVKDGYNWVKVDLRDLLYIKAEDNYISLVMHDRQILTRLSLQEVLVKLTPGIFFKVHKSYIVNTTKILRLENHQVTIGDRKVPVSRPFLDELKRRLLT